MLRRMDGESPQFVDVTTDDRRKPDVQSSLQDGVLGRADDDRVAFAHRQTTDGAKRLVDFRLRQLLRIRRRGTGRCGVRRPRDQSTIFSTARDQGTVRFVD